MPEALLLGLLAATAFGFGDYLLGAQSRRTSLPALIAISQAVAVFALLPVALRTSPSPAAFGWGAAAGAAGLAASYLLLRGYRVGLLAVVSPCASISAAGIPVLVDVATGLNLSPITATGLTLALFAVILVSIEPSTTGRSPTAGLGWGLAAGAAHAAMYLALNTSPDSQNWSLVTVFVIGSIGGVLAALIRRGQRSPFTSPDRHLRPLALIGVASAVGWMSFQAAATSTGVGIAAVLAELSPALTAILGWALLKEPLPPTRRTGLIAAVLACVLIGLAE